MVEEQTLSLVKYSEGWEVAKQADDYQLVENQLFCSHGWLKTVQIMSANRPSIHLQEVAELGLNCGILSK